MPIRFAPFMREVVIKSLNVRVYAHREFDIVLYRNYNSSLNIFRLGKSIRAITLTFGDVA